MTTGYGFEIAIRDIQKGEELTDDYGALNMDYDFQCVCGSQKCRRRINHKDFAYHVDAWDKRIQQAFDMFKMVEQPLITYVDSATYNALMKYLNTGRDYRSIRCIQHPVDSVIIA